MCMDACMLAPQHKRPLVFPIHPRFQWSCVATSTTPLTAPCIRFACSSAAQPGSRGQYMTQSFLQAQDLRMHSAYGQYEHGHVCHSHILFLCASLSTGAEVHIPDAPSQLNDRLYLLLAAFQVWRSWCRAASPLCRMTHLLTIPTLHMLQNEAGPGLPLMMPCVALRAQTTGTSKPTTRCAL